MRTELVEVAERSALHPHFHRSYGWITAQDHFAQLGSELWAVTTAHLRAVAGEAARTALMQVPAGHAAGWAGYPAAPTSSPYAHWEAVRVGAR